MTTSRTRTRLGCRSTNARTPGSSATWRSTTGGLEGSAVARFRGPAPRCRWQRAPCRGARGERRPGLRLQPGDGRGGRGRGVADDPAHRHGRPAGGRAVDGPGRVAVGAELARAVPAPDRHRKAGAGDDPRRGGGGVEPDLPGEGHPGCHGGGDGAAAAFRPGRPRSTRWPAKNWRSIPSRWADRRGKRRSRPSSCSRSARSFRCCRTSFSPGRRASS